MEQLPRSPPPPQGPGGEGARSPFCEVRREGGRELGGLRLPGWEGVEGAGPGPGPPRPAQPPDPQTPAASVRSARPPAQL